MSGCQQAQPHAVAQSKHKPAVLPHFLVGVVLVMVVVFLIYPTLLGTSETDFSGCKPPPPEVNTNVSHAKVEPEKHFSSVLGSYEILTLPPEKLIVRAAYQDPRPRDNFHNVTVFLVVIDKKLLARKRDGIVACGTTDDVSTVLGIRLVQNVDWLHREFPKLTHDLAMIDCFGLHKIDSGDPAFLWYRLMDGGDLYRVESEQPYLVPLPKEDEKQNKLTIVVCMEVLRGLSSFIREFVRYYKHLGVDHIYMMAEESFVSSGALEADEFIQKALMEGFISFSVWHYWLGDGQVYHFSQMLSHENCIYRFQGTYDYALLVDSDDHFIPLVPNQKKLDYYAKRFCEKGACMFHWIEYYPDCGQDWSKLGPNGNVTNTILSHASNIPPGWKKSMYRISAALDAGTHHPYQLMKGFESVIVPSNKAYVAHVRKNRAPPGGMQSC